LLFYLTIKQDLENFVKGAIARLWIYLPVTNVTGVRVWPAHITNRNHRPIFAVQLSM